MSCDILGFIFKRKGKKNTFLQPKKLVVCWIEKSLLIHTRGYLVWKILIETYKELADLENPSCNSTRTSIELKTLCERS